MVFIAVSACSGGGGGAMPSGMIAMFDGACPDGWSRFEPLDGRFPRGAAMGGHVGGSETHGHTFDLVARTSREGAHEHNLAGGELIDVDTGFFGTLGIWNGYLQAFEEAGRDREKTPRARARTEAEGAHDHLISAQGDTQVAEHLPPYLEVVFCRKD